MSNESSRVMSIEEAAVILHLSRGSAYQAAATGELPTIRIGKRLLVPRARLFAMLGERDEDAP